MVKPDPDATVDIQFRNGQIRRGVKAGKWRFGNWTGKDRDNHPHDFDIVKWQPAKEE